MSRAEIRRSQKENKKSNTATYNFTKSQLDAVINKRIGEKLTEVKKQATDDAINTAMTLLLTLPLEVLMDHYWKKTYTKKLPEFTAHVLDYYEKWQNDELNMDELREDLWLYGGIKIKEQDDNE